MQNIMSKFKLINDTEEQREMLQELFIQNLEDENNINITAEHLEEVLKRGHVVEIVSDEVFFGIETIADLINRISNKISCLNDVRAIMLKFIVHPDFLMMDIAEIIAQLEMKLPEETLVIFATETNLTLSIENLKISTLVSYNEECKGEWRVIKILY